MTTESQRVDESTNAASTGSRQDHADRSEKHDQGEAWEINDPSPSESDDEEHHEQSRTGGDYEGGSWRINENTAD